MARKSTKINAAKREQYGARVSMLSGMPAAFANKQKRRKRR